MTFRRAFLRYAGIGVVALVAVATVSVFVAMKVDRDHALREAVAGSETVATRVVAPLVTPGVYDGMTNDLKALQQRVRIREAGTSIKRVTVWSADGVILYSDDPRLIGQRYPLDVDRSGALAGRGVESTVTDLGDPQNALAPLGRTLQVSAGARATDGRPILVQINYAVDQLDAEQTTLTHRIITIALVSLLALALLYVRLTYSLARRLSA